MKKKGFLILLGVLLLFNLNIAFAAESPFRSLVTLISDVDFIGTYESNPGVVETVLFLILFIALGTMVSKTVPSLNNKQGKIAMIILGIMLAIGTSIASKQNGYFIYKLIPFLWPIISIGIGALIFYLVRFVTGTLGKGENKSGISAFAFLIAYIAANTFSNGKLYAFFKDAGYEWIPAMTILIALIVLLTSLGSFAKMMRGTVDPDGAGMVEKGLGSAGRIRDAWKKFKGDGKKEENKKSETPAVTEKTKEEKFYVRYGSGKKPISGKELKEDSQKIMKSMELEILDENQLYDYIKEGIAKIEKEILIEDNAISELKKRGKEKDMSDAIIGIAENIEKEVGKIMSVAISDLNNHKKNMKKMEEIEEKIVPSLLDDYKKRIGAAFKEYSNRIKKYWQMSVENSNPLFENLMRTLEQQKQNARVINATPDDKDEVEKIIKELQKGCAIQKQTIMKIKANLEEHKSLKINEVAKYVANEVVKNLPEAIGNAKIAKFGEFDIFGEKSNASNMFQVISALERDSDNTIFLAHVTEKHNHFAEWIKPVDDDFGNHLAKIRNKSDLISELKRYINNHCQYPF